MGNKFDKIKELKQMLDEGSITQEEFSQMKADLLSENSNTEDSKASRSFQLDKGKERKGVGWPEVLSVLFGIYGGLGYLFTKQPTAKKLVILVLSFLATGVYASLEIAITNTQESQMQESGDSQRTTAGSQESEAKEEQTIREQKIQQEEQELRKKQELSDKFNAERQKILNSANKMMDQGQYEEVIKLADKYAFVNDENLNNLKSQAKDKLAAIEKEYAALVAQLPSFIPELVQEKGESIKSKSWFDREFMIYNCDEVAPAQIEETVETKSNHDNGQPSRWTGSVPTASQVASEAESSYRFALRCGYAALLLEDKEYLKKAISLINKAEKYSTNNTLFIAKVKSGEL
ncbi:SHOCT domain-containing protein [Dactylococcopsis salina]|uniref:SHOCT domain-containing protein n=1 Tax=Dactylococcopsis salina (strain PCC 8305) TaxID=13035 RepID=K9YX24_DACS8|nr:SHOCT domain-containing protein [Dactylococcopsis salina]AFZ51464.1 hypothetical protein Dacsa_2911 [Dactylococcopsis salina PCC 8305]